jgi:hypothetical protein
VIEVDAIAARKAGPLLPGVIQTVIVGRSDGVSLLRRDHADRGEQRRSGESDPCGVKRPLKTFTLCSVFEFLFMVRCSVFV